MITTEEQLTAIRSPAKKLTIVACAGSGKTTTLIEKIKHMANQPDVRTEEIGIITYTNAAADVLRKRLMKEANPAYAHLGTTHSLIYRLVRIEHEARGFKPPTILPEGSASELLLTAAQMVGYKGSEKRLNDCYERSKYMSLKQRLTPEENAVARYRHMLATEGFYDYNTILVEGLRLITEGHGKTLDFVRSIKHLLVDEFQDAASIDIATFLAWPAETKTFVGDTNQSIFGWRGADREVFQRLKADGFIETKLSVNFRCAAEIVTAANNLIKYNVDHADYEMTAFNEVKGSVWHVEAGSQDILRAKIIDELKIAMGSGAKPSEMAVLCRTNLIADTYRSAIEQAGIPVEKEVKNFNIRDWPTAKLWLAFLASPDNNTMLRLLCQQAVLHFDEDYVIQAIEKGLSVNGLKEFVPEESPRMTLDDLALTGRKFNIDSDCIKHLVENYGNLTPGQALAEIKGGGDSPFTKSTEGVACVTAHSAKGREWDFVVVTEMTEGIWPLGSCSKIPELLREERRLAYVAMTRARYNLVLANSTSVIPPWGRRPEPASISRFITEALS